MWHSFWRWISYRDLPRYREASESDRRCLRRAAWFGGLRFWGFWAAAFAYGLVASVWAGAGLLWHLLAGAIVGVSFAVGMRLSMDRLTD